MQLNWLGDPAQQDTFGFGNGELYPYKGHPHRQGTVPLLRHPVKIISTAFVLMLCSGCSSTGQRTGGRCVLRRFDRRRRQMMGMTSDERCDRYLRCARPRWTATPRRMFAMQRAEERRIGFIAGLTGLCRRDSGRHQGRFRARWSAAWCSASAE